MKWRDVVTLLQTIVIIGLLIWNYRLNRVIESMCDINDSIIANIDSIITLITQIMEYIK